MKFYIEYKVPNMTGEKVHAAGPYTVDQLPGQRQDLEGYGAVILGNVPEDELDSRDW